MIEDYVKDGVTYVAEVIQNPRAPCSCGGCSFDGDVEKCVAAPDCTNIGTNSDIHIIWVVKS